MALFSSETFYFFELAKISRRDLLSFRSTEFAKSSHTQRRRISQSLFDIVFRSSEQCLRSFRLLPMSESHRKADGPIAKPTISLATCRLIQKIHSLAATPYSQRLISSFPMQPQPLHAITTGQKSQTNLACNYEGNLRHILCRGCCSLPIHENKSLVQTSVLQ